MFTIVCIFQSYICISLGKRTNSSKLNYPDETDQVIEKPKKKATQKEPVQPEQDNRSEPVDDPAAKAPAPVRRSAPGRVLGAANYTAAEIEGSSPLLTLLCVLSLSASIQLFSIS